MTPTEALAELQSALAPVVDLSLEHKPLAVHIPRLAEAFEALRASIAEAEGGSLGNLARSLLESGPGARGGRSRSAATLAALADAEAGMPVAAAARKHGVQASTLFRARAQDREALREALAARE